MLTIRVVFFGAAGLGRGAYVSVEVAFHLIVQLGIYALDRLFAVVGHDLRFPTAAPRCVNVCKVDVLASVLAYAHSLFCCYLGT